MHRKLTAMGVKAFELVPAVERLKLMSDKARTEIECIESCGKNLYIGTNDCFVVHYKVEEQLQSNGRILYKSEKLGHKYLALKKPIVQLKSVSALNRIIVLCDNTLALLNMMDLEPVAGSTKLKNVQCFCLNEHPVKGNPFSVEIGVALRKKQIQVYTVTEDKIQLHREVPTPELPMGLSMDGVYVCMAGLSQYYILNYSTGHTQELFPYNAELTKPCIKRIMKDEFLLSGPNALGMFATSSGISQRPPLHWSEHLLDIAYNHPYILALNDEFITVHSILDQQQKQSIAFQGGQCLGEFDGRIFVASSKEIYALVPVAIEKQVQALLTDGRVTEALELAKNAKKTGLSKEKFLKMYQRIQQQAGFIEFSKMNLDQARELFFHGKLDVRELISLYPLLLPKGCTFARSVPPLHEIADINQLAQGDEDKVQTYKTFLLQYLEEIRPTHHARICEAELDTALLKLYAETNSPELESLIVSFLGNAQDCESWLAKYGHHHAMALLYRFKGSHDQALGIWAKLLAEEASDESFPGLPFFVEVLANLEDPELVWKYVDQVMERDEVEAVKVFTERSETEMPTDRLGPDLVVDYLARFPKAIILYLEFLVLKKKSESEKLHTHLAVLYLDSVLQMLSDPNVEPKELDMARYKLQEMLQNSSLYRVQMILGKVRQTELHKECAILYGKLEEHDKALRIFVHKLRDYKSAEAYCEINSQGKDSVYRKRLFQTLLNVYLDPTNERHDNMVGPAVSLLNNNQADFDTLKVLQVIPDNWSVGLLSQFLNCAIRKNMHCARTTHIERMLARSQSIQVQAESLQNLRVAVQVGEERICSVCEKPFTEPSFVRYPNGVITHTHCARNKHLCPVTGRLFCTTTKDSK